MSEFPIQPVQTDSTQCEWHDDSPKEPVAAVASSRLSVEPSSPSFADATTMGVGGKIATYIEATTEQEIIDAVEKADAEGRPLFVLGAGSNTVPADDEFDGVVIRDARNFIKVDSESACGGASITAAAGTPWDTLVAAAVENGWMGIEALSGIPGTVGAAPIQNIGAYGQEVAETLASVRVYDRAKKRPRLLPLADLELGYRTSVMKRSLTDAEAGGGRTWGPTGRYVVLEVEFQMRHATQSAPIRYQQLADKLGVEVGDRVESRELRQAVLELRRSKGMVLDDEDRDTWSAGSFFTNPVISKDQAANIPEDAPRYPVYDHTMAVGIKAQIPLREDVVKLSAAWLIEHAGFGKGFKLEGSNAAVSSKHTLSIVNLGGATGQQIRELAEHIRDGVKDVFGITLDVEPVLM